MRRYVLSLVLLVSLAALVAGCGDILSADRSPETSGREDGEEPTVYGTTAGSGEERGATVGVAAPASSTRTPVPAEAAEGGRSEAPFVADPQASGGSSYEADAILAVRYGVHEGYERVVLDLGTGSQPAGTVPEWRLSSPTGDGLLRVLLPSVSSTGVSDGSFDGPLLESFYVVRAPEGGMFVDVFAGSAFYYRVLELSDPARLVVDFKPSGGELAFPLPAKGGNTVLTAPRSGARIDSPLTVSGYSRNFEASNTITLRDSGGNVLVRETVLSNDWSATWGYFETTLDFPPFSGRGTLQVGTQSARDGSFQGVEIPVFGG
jgi:hypothetical protein